MNSVRVFITTCDNYLPALRPMAWLLNKYWKPEPPECVVMGFTPPEFELPDNFSFHSVGRQEDYPFQKWTDAVIKFLNEVDDEVFVLLLDDMWPTRGIDGRAIDMLTDYMRQFRYVARIDLTGDRLYAHGMKPYGSLAWLDLIISMPGSPYHSSLMAGIWNRQHMLGLLKPGWTAHDVELSGTTELSHNRDVIVLGTRQWPFRHCLALRALEKDKLLLDDPVSPLEKTDIEAMRALGYFEHWEGTR